MSEPKSTGPLIFPADKATQGDIPLRLMQTHYAPVEAECPIDDTSKKKGKNHELDTSL
jgi:hypothetical protein